MPGNSADPEQFTNLQFQNQSGSFVNYKCAVLTDGNDGGRTRADGEKWFLVTPACPSFNIYTDTAG